MNIIKKIANGVAKTEFASKAIKDAADLSAFKERPTARISFGIALIVISYIIGWPAIGLCGTLSFYWREPLIIVIGAPLFYILAHVVFFAGIYLAGGRYARVFLRWVTRVSLEKLM